MRRQEFSRLEPSTMVASAWARTMAACFAVYRLANALFVDTTFHPDEFWQGPEVAHRLVFGYGHLTWEWRHRIRHYVHVLLIAPGFVLLRVLGADTPRLVHHAPRVLQALWATAADVATVRAAQRHSGSDRIAACVAAAQATSGFIFYCAVRAFSNSTEYALTACALSCWPVDDAEGDWVPLSLAAASVCVRPTAAATWLVCGVHLALRRWRQGALWPLVGRVVAIGASSLVVLLCADRVGYGEWHGSFSSLPAVRFLVFNAMEGKSSLFGEHPALWYLACGLPVTLGTSAVFVLGGVCWGVTGGNERSAVAARRAAFIVAFVVVVLSMQPHKEFRFLLPLFPFLMYLCGLGIHKSGLHPRLAAIGLAALTAPAVVYVSRVHDRAPLVVMAGLRQLQPDSVDFLTNCHTTPFYASLHMNVPLRYLDCSAKVDHPGVETEAQRFFADPVGGWHARYGSWWHRRWRPSHIVLWESTLRALANRPSRAGYRTVFEAPDFDDKLLVLSRMPSGHSPTAN